MTLAHLSHSSISLFGLCARRWEFKYVRGLRAPATPALVFGSAWHGTVERAVKAHASGREPDLDSIWEQEWNKATEQEVDWGGDIPERFANDGLRMLGTSELRRFLASLEALVDERGLVIERKIELQVPGIPIPVIGYVDMVAADGTVVDFKTAGRAWTAQHARDEKQPLIYLAALNQAGTPHRPGWFRHIVFIKGGPQVMVFDSERTAGQLFGMLGEIRRTWTVIETGDFEPNFEACWAYGRRCEFWRECRGG